MDSPSQTLHYRKVRRHKPVVWVTRLAPPHEQLVHVVTYNACFCMSIKKVLHIPLCFTQLLCLRLSESKKLPLHPFCRSWGALSIMLPSEALPLGTKLGRWNLCVIWGFHTALGKQSVHTDPWWSPATVGPTPAQTHSTPVLTMGNQSCCTIELGVLMYSHVEGLANLLHDLCLSVIQGYL